MIKIDFPQAQKVGDGVLKYNTNFIRNFNKNINEVQKFLDTTVQTNLQPYVSYKTGTQEKSIVSGSVAGSGKVIINVPYAEYQAYSKRIKKRNGKRGTQPFERMKADKKDSILRQVQNYARRLSNGK